LLLTILSPLRAAAVVPIVQGTVLVNIHYQLLKHCC
jgi:hypothetical protein